MYVQKDQFQNKRAYSGHSLGVLMKAFKSGAALISYTSAPKPVGSDEDMLLGFKGYHPPNAPFEALTCNFHMQE
jgi:hypothetical protein